MARMWCLPICFWSCLASMSRQAIVTWALAIPSSMLPFICIFRLDAFPVSMLPITCSILLICLTFSYAFRCFCACSLLCPPLRLSLPPDLCAHPTLTLCLIWYLSLFPPQSLFPLRLCAGLWRSFMARFWRLTLDLFLSCVQMSRSLSAFFASVPVLPHVIPVPMPALWLMPRHPCPPLPLKVIIQPVHAPAPVPPLPPCCSWQGNRPLECSRGFGRQRRTILASMTSFP